jgi:hypothetical protein
MWFVADNGQLVVETDADSFKVKRIPTRPRMSGLPCATHADDCVAQAVDAEATNPPGQRA